MKSMLILTLSLVLSLMGCQIGGTVSPTPQAEAGEVDTGLSVEPTVVAATAIEELPSTVEGLPQKETSSAEAQAAPTGNANVLFVSARLAEDGTWTFAVTVEHDDMGWEDYSDGWDVVLPDGKVSKPDPESPFTRLLLHPHETEQPFTRSQSGIMIPAGIDIITVRAHDLVDGFGGREIKVDLAADRGPDFEVVR